MLLAATGSASGQCITFYDTPPYLRSANETRLVATVLDGQARDTLWSPRSAFGYHWKPVGQFLAVEEADGPGATRLGSDSTVVVVRWGGIDDACEWVPSSDSLAPRSRHVFTAILRADSLWIDGRPTLDVPPQPLGEFLGSAASGMKPSLEEYREFLSVLPSREEWGTDCRPGVDRVRLWLSRHPEATRWPQFATVERTFRPTCERWLETRATLLERDEATRPIPTVLRDFARTQDCREGDDVWSGWDTAIDGHFIESDAQQWALICVMQDHWRLLVVLPDPPGRIIELARLAGNERSWLAGAAPAEYFDWTSSPEFGDGRWSVPGPRRDVVLLRFISGAPDQTLAFYETEAGWVHVGVRCCNWSQGP